ncbi:uncharacterized protein LOC110981799 [Acanthaster planci]|uniref:Uncharacterized protein LOC110981799 n=1 Tax=Acanthaster planci TaxID=133434 RepID=A0A8B7YRV0_ACAPL|nr:uncharacterized protein LOC110981799 [Acanthaster planci]
MANHLLLHEENKVQGDEECGTSHQWRSPKETGKATKRKHSGNNGNYEAKKLCTGSSPAQQKGTKRKRSAPHSDQCEEQKKGRCFPVQCSEDNDMTVLVEPLKLLVFTEKDDVERSKKMHALQEHHPHLTFDQDNTHVYASIV